MFSTQTQTNWFFIVDIALLSMSSRTNKTCLCCSTWQLKFKIVFLLQFLKPLLEQDIIRSSALIHLMFYIVKDVYLVNVATSVLHLANTASLPGNDLEHIVLQVVVYLYLGFPDIKVVILKNKKPTKVIHVVGWKLC